MKPRDQINRRKNTYLIIAAIGFLTMTAVAYTKEYLPPAAYEMASAGSIAVFIGGVLAVYFGIRCPKCKSILGLKYVYAEETLLRCPGCGTVFDEDSP